MRILVVTTAYPTREEPYRGAPIWATLGAFPGLAEFEVACSLARGPEWLRRRIAPHSYLRPVSKVDLARNPAAPARSLPYFSIPGVTRWFNGRFLARALERRAAEWRPDAILAYRVYPDGYAAVEVGERLGIPVIVSTRGSDLKKLPSMGLARRDTIHAARRAAAVIAVSEDLAQIARELGSRNVHVVRNGVNREVFHPVEQSEARRTLGVAGDARLVVFVGNLLPVKNVPLLLDAVARLHRAGERWEVALIGEGVDEQALRARAAALGIADSVRFLGAEPAEAVAAWMNAGDIFCLPSESEGLPNVVIEALACGRAVVGTRVGGIPELVTEDAGIVVAPGDAAALADAIARAGRTAWDRERIAARQAWTWRDAARRTIEICAEARGAIIE